MYILELFLKIKILGFQLFTASQSKCTVDHIGIGLPYNARHYFQQEYRSSKGEG